MAGGYFSDLPRTFFDIVKGQKREGPGLAWPVAVGAVLEDNRRDVLVESERCLCGAGGSAGKPQGKEHSLRPTKTPEPRPRRVIQVRPTIHEFKAKDPAWR